MESNGKEESPEELHRCERYRPAQAEGALVYCRPWSCDSVEQEGCDVFLDSVSSLCDSDFFSKTEEYQLMSSTLEAGL